MDKDASDMGIRYIAKHEEKDVGKKNMVAARL